MAILVACSCGRKLRASAELVGRKVFCPDCGKPVIIQEGKPQPTSWSTIEEKPRPTPPSPAPAPPPAAPPEWKSPAALKIAGSAAAALLLIILALILTTGGEEPVVAEAVAATPAPPPAASPKKKEHVPVSFETSILPILEARCIKCHQAPRKENGRTIKPKAGLELDTREGIEAGSEFTKVVIPGDPLNSPLYSMSALPADHDDRMPPKGDPLSTEELLTIKRWIKEGAEFGDWKGGSTPIAVKPAPPKPAQLPAVAKAPEPPKPPAPKPAPAPPAPTPAPPKTVVAGQAIDFENTVLPIIKARCWNCHEKDKQQNGRTVRAKAGLRLDGRGWFLKGSDNGKVLVPGKPDQSSLYTLVTLPADHDDRMPSKGEPLTDRQKDVLKKWILQGADFGQWRGQPGGIVSTVKGPEGGPAPLLRANRVTTVEELGKTVKPASKLAMEKAAQSGGRIEVAFPGTSLLRVQFLGSEADTGNDQVAALAPVGAQVTQLLLGRTKVTDGAMSSIAKFRNLTKLDLNRTGVGDSGMAQLNGLKELRSLNLYGTGVTDASVGVLSGLSKLEKLYVRDTKITEAGVKKLRKSLPNTKIISAFQTPVPPRPDPDARRRR